jgi:hypothetical protein
VRVMKITKLTIAGIVAIVLTSTIGTITLASAAQLKNLRINNMTSNSTDPSSMLGGRQNPSLGPVMNPSSTANINNGSISVTPLIAKAIISQIRTDTGNATIVAEKAVGNGSHTVSANLGVENNFLAYIIVVIDNNSNFHKVIVDAGTGKVLSSILSPEPLNIMNIIGGRQSGFSSANRMVDPGMISPPMSLSQPPQGGMTLTRPFP